MNLNLDDFDFRWILIWQIVCFFCDITSIGTSILTQQQNIEYGMEWTRLHMRDCLIYAFDPVKLNRLTLDKKPLFACLLINCCIVILCVSTLITKSTILFVFMWNINTLIGIFMTFDKQFLFFRINCLCRGNINWDRINL